MDIVYYSIQYHVWICNIMYIHTGDSIPGILMCPSTAPPILELVFLKYKIIPISFWYLTIHFILVNLGCCELHSNYFKRVKSFKIIKSQALPVSLQN